MTFTDFNDIELDEKIAQAVRDLGYITPTKVQQEVIPIILEGKDIIVKSETGSGKTAAFGIPLCDNIIIEATEPQALILTPTRELAVQVKEDIKAIGRYKKIRCAAVFGKQPMQAQVRELKQRVHAVVGTPGRVLDHINKGTLILNDIRYLIIDEADEMLNMGFIEEVEDIIRHIPKSRVTMLFSATFPEALDELSKRHMDNPLYVEINPGKLTVENIDHYYIETAEDDKFQLLLNTLYIEKPDSCLIFCRTQERTSNLAYRLNQKRIPCRELHGGMLQNERLDTMKEFKRGAYPFLVATDVAARGIDIEAVTHVINYDIPLEKERYVHRIGRTGRAGSKGRAILFVTPGENKFLKEIEEYIDMTIQSKPAPAKEEAVLHEDTFFAKLSVKPKLKEAKSAKLDEGILKLYIGAGKKNKLRPGDIVGAITNIDGVTADDIGIIDILDYVAYVDILNNKGKTVLKALQKEKIKGRQMRVDLASKKE